MRESAASRKSRVNDRGPKNWDDHVFREIVHAICLGPPSKRDREIIAASLAGIAPKDPLEKMIVAQMLACHEAALACYADAWNNAKSPGQRREHLAQAGKLSRTFAMLCATLDQHRGKGHQRIVVEHVNVHPGGQAVVGIVDAKGEGFNRIREIDPVTRWKDQAKSPSGSSRMIPEFGGASS